MCNTSPKKTHSYKQVQFSFVGIFSLSGYKFLPVKNMIVNASLLIMFNLIFCFILLLLFTSFYLSVVELITTDESSFTMITRRKKMTRTYGFTYDELLK